jgi:hypothetical protein
MSMVYLETTDKDGNATITDHMCWDAGRFTDARRTEARKNGGVVRELTQDEYRAVKWRKAANRSKGRSRK